jgi:DNA-binding MarR family transcriptional regulator
MAEADLDRLLARLLRVMNPAAADQADRAVPEDTVPATAGFPAVSASEARALIELLVARGIAQGQLAALLGLEKSTVSRLAAGLERKGWLRRGRDEENQRYVRLYLTPEGRVIAARVWQAWQSRQARILAGLSPEERAGLAAGLRGLVRGLASEGLLADAASLPPSPAPAGIGLPEPRAGLAPPDADPAVPDPRPGLAPPDADPALPGPGRSAAQPGGLATAGPGGMADLAGAGGSDRYTETPSA